ncbi:MAG: 4'-phosphopantetheinyl transferase superfamily protein [Prolixibacteraceae bacterium]|jgi:4'-phosphopantetheinyl transferase|nr:4'-phosphopantetheinyl transferase superfamily protein [Prolixibacteraceae bacterium]
MIKVYYAYTEYVAEAELNELVKPLSEQVKSRLAGFKKEEDRLLLLTASYLLKEALAKNGYPDYRLKNLQYTQAGKPFFPGSPFDFSISHTDYCAAVAFSTNCRVGIDIEKIKTVDLADFKTVFPEEVWTEIETSVEPTETFYSHWTLLESAVKADGRGLPLLSSNHVKVKDGQVIINGKRWFSQHLSFDPSISCCIASGLKQETVELIEIKPIYKG